MVMMNLLLKHQFYTTGATVTSYRQTEEGADVVLADNSFVSGNWYEVGSGDAKGFEDKMDIMGLSYTYHPENIIPEGYQFYTCSDKNKWMEGWLPEYDLESGLKDYVKYLATQG